MAARRHPKRARQWTSAAAARLIRLSGGAASAEAAVTAVATRLLDGINCPPTDLATLAERLNVVGWTKEDIVTSGELRVTANGFEIVCESRSSSTRDRFSIAHEMGHIVFELSGPNPPRHGRELEILCDMMAAELLMPAAPFKEYFRRDPSLSGMFALSREFRTSLRATAIRCHQLVGVPVFEVDDRRVVWERGINKRLRPALDEAVRYVDCGNRDLRDALKRTLDGNVVDSPVYLYEPNGWGMRWRLQGHPIGSGNHALFMLVELLD